MDTQTIQSEALELLQTRLKAGSEVSLTVHGRSMAPALLPGDRILVQPCLAITELKTADVLILAGGDGWVAHRLLALEHSDSGGELLITRGDNSPNPDPPWPATSVLGRVAGAFRNDYRIEFRQPWTQRCRHFLRRILK